MEQQYQDGWNPRSCAKSLSRTSHNNLNGTYVAELLVSTSEVNVSSSENIKATRGLLPVISLSFLIMSCFCGAQAHTVPFVLCGFACALLLCVCQVGEGYGKLWAGKDATYALAVLSLKPEEAQQLDRGFQHLMRLNHL